MEIFTWYLIASYFLMLTLMEIMSFKEYRPLIFAPITIWILIYFIIKESLPEDFWTRPIIKIKKK